MKKSKIIISILLPILLLIGCNSYTNPPDKFLVSKVVTPMGMNNFPLGEITVNEFVEMLSKKQLDNGKTPEINGWTANDNTYTLHAKLKDQEMEIHFTHILSEAQGAGLYSGMSARIGEQDFSGLDLMRFLVY